MVTRTTKPSAIVTRHCRSSGTADVMAATPAEIDTATVST